MARLSIQLKNTQQKTYHFTLGALTTTFFLWGFIASFNDILIPHLKSVFDLNYSQAMLIQFCFFIAYFFVSLPAGRIVKRIGYKNGVVTGLVIAGFGCLLFYPAAEIELYPLFLLALFVLASGITFLQVSANPYVTTLGTTHTAASRLTLMQGFNSLGTTVGPIVGSLLILSAVLTDDPIIQEQQTQASSVQLPYLFISALLFILAFTFKKLSLQEKPLVPIKDVPATIVSGQQKLMLHTYLASVGIFAYVGAEIAIASLLISYLSEPYILNISHSSAALYLAYYFGGSMLGRFFGAYIMRRVVVQKLLAFNAIMAITLIVISISFSGTLSMVSILAVGLSNSIMFPAIFSLGVKDLGEATSQGSGILCLGIVGGAFIPMLQATFADNYGLQLSFLVPICCYIYILYFGLIGANIRIKR